VSGEPTDQVSGVARILPAGDPCSWRRLQAEHVADRTGHCRSCRRYSPGSPVWPCRLRMIADEAERLALSTRPRARADRSRIRR
jgi:hypothetical protein